MAPELVITQGLRRTRSTLELWHRERWRVLIPWFAGSFTIAVLLLVAVWVVYLLVTPDDARFTYFGVFPDEMSTVLARTDFFDEAPGAERTRGSKCTSGDAAFLHRTTAGVVQLVLVEWKYVES